RGGQLFRADRLVASVPVETNPRHADAAQLEVDVRALRDVGEAATPSRKHLLVAVAVRTGSVQAAKMVQNDSQIGYRPSKFSQLGQLRKAYTGIEGQPHPRQYAGPGLVFRGGQHALFFPVFAFRVR